MVIDHSKLIEGLNRLDKYLSKAGLSVEIVICGAFAIHLHGISRAVYTQDVDTLNSINSKEILDAIKSVGEQLGLGPNWLNDQASTVSLPYGIVDRAKPLNQWKTIRASLVARSDLIKMKASAFSIRRDVTNKDWDDLVLLEPSLEEIESAIDFVKTTNSPPEHAPKINADNFKETINDLRNLIK